MRNHVGIRLSTLGEICVRGPGSTEPISIRPRVLALLTRIAADADADVLRRDLLLGVFWPESDDRRARQSLRRHLYLLRRSVGDVVDSLGREELAVDPDRLWCDSRAFESAHRAGLHEEALSLYRGEFAPGLHVDGAHAFDGWLHARRRDLRTMALASGEALVDRALVNDDAPTALLWAERVAGLDPLDERAVRRVIDLRVEAGDRAGAIRHYEGLRERLRQALDVEPSEITTRRIERLRRGVGAPAPHAHRVDDVDPAPRATEPTPRRGRPTRTRSGSGAARGRVGVAVAAGLGAVLLVGWMGRSARGPHGGEAPSGPAQPVDQLLALGDLYTARGSSAALLDRAITTFREAAELRPEDGATHAGVARAAATVAGTWPWRTEHLDTARSALRRAAIVAPEAPSTLLARAIVSFHDRRDLDQARRDLEKVLEDRPDDPEALLYMGRTLTAMGSLDRALPSLERGRRLAPSDPRVHVALGRALRIAGRLDEALHTLDEAWALAPDDLWAYLSLFWALVAAGDYEGAEELVAARPAGLDHRFVAPGLGHVAFHRGDLVSAMELLAAESHPDAQTLAQAAHLLGDTTAQRRWARIALERAENALARVHEAAPEERSTVLLAHTFGRLGLAHALLGHEAAARDHAQRARATHPAERDLEMGFPPVMLRARTLAVLGDVAGARAELAPWLERPSLLYRAPGALGPLLGPVVDAGPRSPAARRPVGLGTPLRVSSDQPG